MFEVTVESVDLETRNKKGGGTYQVQTAYAHTFTSEGPKRYPEEIRIFPKRDAQGKTSPYPPGEYVIHPKCLHVRNGFLELGFVELMPKRKEK